MAGASSRCYCVMDPGAGPAALALSFQQRSGHLAFQHTAWTSWHSSTLSREPSPTAPCDSTARTVLTHHCWSCQVLGTHLDLPFLHFLQPSAAAASSPSLSRGAALQEGGISVPCF